MSDWIRRYHVGLRIAVALGALAVASCFGDAGTAPVQSGKRMTPSSDPDAAIVADQCIITANVNPGSPLTNNPTSGGQCGIFWQMQRPPLATPNNVEGFWWVRDDGAVTFPTMPHMKFETCCSGAGDLQNGPLLVDFSPAVRSVTVRTWDRSVYQLGAPAGLFIRAVNAQGDTIARATTDGSNPPTLQGSGIVRLVIYPIFTNLVNAYGDKRIVPVIYQIEYVPECPWVDDPLLRNPAFLKELQNRLEAGNPSATPGTGVKRETGGTAFGMSDNSDTWVPWTDPNATECAYNGIAAYQQTFPQMTVPNANGVYATGAKAMYHSHVADNNQAVYGCPRGTGGNADPPKRAGETDAFGNVKKPIIAYPDDPFYGGGSEDDWKQANQFEIPVYVVSVTGRLYVLKPGTPRSKWKDNPNRYQFPDARGCPVLMAPGVW